MPEFVKFSVLCYNIYYKFPFIRYTILKEDLMIHSKKNLAVEKLSEKISPTCLSIRKAKPDDAEALLKIASSVGKKSKEPTKGFLMDDYTKNTKNHLQHFNKLINDLDYV